MRYRDPDERDNEKSEIDNTPKITRELVRARMHSKTIVVTLPNDIREPVGILYGTKLMLTVIDNKADLEELIGEGRKAVLITKE